VSALRQRADEYLTIRRSLGFKLTEHGQLLGRFIDSLDAAGATVITTEAALSWAQSSAASRAREGQRLSVVRCFASYMEAIDPYTQVPPRDLLSARFNRRVPYLYTPTEVTALMAAARSVSPPLQAATYETMIGLLAATGMRLGEAVGLSRDDVDVSGQLLVVRCGKNTRSRLVPIHVTTAMALARYGRRRDQLCSRPKSCGFFVTTRGDRLSRSSIQHAFIRFRHQTGLDTLTRRRTPRLHDLRHTFVVRTLLNWYRAGVDVQAQLPVLSTYLGHVDPNSTYWYFDAAPELMVLVAERLQQQFWDNPS
jgi:integrase/recombinase XerD